jgi:hypothetical protein
MNEAAFLTVVSDDFSYLEPDHFRDVPRYALPQESALSSVQPVASRGSAPPQAVKNPKGDGQFDIHKIDQLGFVHLYDDGGAEVVDEEEYYAPGSEDAKELFKLAGVRYPNLKREERKERRAERREERRAGEEDIGEAGDDKKKRDSRSGKKAGVFGAFLGSFAKGFLKSDDASAEEPPATGGTDSGGGMDPTTMALIAVGGVVVLGGVVFLATRK